MKPSNFGGLYQLAFPKIGPSRTPFLWWYYGVLQQVSTRSGKVKQFTPKVFKILLSFFHTFFIFHTIFILQQKAHTWRRPLEAKMLGKRIPWEVVQKYSCPQKDLRGSMISWRLHYLFVSGVIKTSSHTCFPTRHSWKCRCIRSGCTGSGWTRREIPQRRKYSTN